MTRGRIQQLPLLPEDTPIPVLVLGYEIDETTPIAIRVLDLVGDSVILLQVLGNTYTMEATGQLS